VIESVQHLGPAEESVLYICISSSTPPWARAHEGDDGDADEGFCIPQVPW
jgi:hypothetical protein